MSTEIVRQMLSSKKYAVLTDYARILSPNQGPLIVSPYEGDHVRVFKEGDTSHVLCPSDMTVVMEGALAEAITSGTIFEDTDMVQRNADYLMQQTMPIRAITRGGFEQPNGVRNMAQLVMGKLDPDTKRIDISDVDVENGSNFIHDIVLRKPACLKDANAIVSNYCGDNDICSTDDDDIKTDIADLTREIEMINSIEPEDAISDEDYDLIDIGNPDPELVEEGFFSKRPKKLKPIPRDIIPYITVEMNAIQDTNDQAMLSGYTCSKLELVDFYLNVIDQNDARYIVPHTRDYLVNMQNELNKLLAAILKLRPVNKNDRVWRVGVNYPEDWRG